MVGVVVAVIGIICTCTLLRFIQLLSANVKSKIRTSPCKTLIVMGSGGHTTEMLRLLSGLNVDRYYPRVYVLGQTDKMSLEKVEAFESPKGAKAAIEWIPRAREVRQSYVSSVYSTIIAIIFSLPLVLRTWPDLVLCNGPGTCIPVCFWAYLITFLGAKKIKICYVESICRVEHLSLSAKILYYVADHLIVQWPQLQLACPRTRYIGRVC